MANNTIKTMKLYVQVERVFNELRELGLSDTDKIEVETLSRFDQYHYEGVEAVSEAIRRCHIGPKSRVLEVGSGIGGPARYLAHRASCQVTALELQADLNEIGRNLTARTNLSGLVNHQQGDFLEAVSDEKYDTLVSWLAFLHIPDRSRLLQQCFDHLNRAGWLYIEDFSKLSAFTDHEQSELRTKIYCDYVPTVGEYVTQVESAGFVDIEVEDMTSHWAEFVRSRFDQFRADAERHRRIHGAFVVDGLDDFYATMSRLYEGGNLGGLRLTARKP